MKIIYKWLCPACGNIAETEAESTEYFCTQCGVRRIWVINID
jgi:DNA-directed RNA polymerase subunit RPC12/RpoP